MSPPKTYNIIIVPSDHSGTRQLQVSRIFLLAAIVVAALVVVTLAIFAATYTTVLAEARRAEGLELENERLTEQVDRVNELSHELEAISGLRAQVFNMLGASDEESATGVRPRVGDTEPSDSILRDTERLQSLYAEEARKPFAPRSWPVEGRVRREYFAVQEGATPPHPGLALDVLPEERVRSAGAGRVTRIETVEGPTQRVDIDHGYGFQSRYEAAMRLLVEEGQSVGRGQALGEVEPNSGQAPNRGSRIPEAGLYFELRVDGTPVDPRFYLTPR